MMQTCPSSRDHLLLECQDDAMNFRELGRKLRELGTADNGVKVLDVDHSATTYKLPQIEARVRVGVYYLRPPDGVSGQEMKDLFDQAEDPAFRYKLTSGIATDHMELLTPDDYARQYFSWSASDLIHIEGARRLAREQLDEMFDEMKAEFDPKSFPHLDDVTISGHKRGDEDTSTEVKLLSYDDDYRSMSAIERAITHKLSEGNLQREIMVTRHLVKDTMPEIILSTTAKATAKGADFLNNLAEHLLTRDGGLQTQAIREKTKPVERSEASVYKELTQAFPRAHTLIKEPIEIVNHAVREFRETMERMAAFKDLQIKETPQTIQVQFSKKLFGGRRFDAGDLKILNAVHNTILGSPGLHDGWNAYHLYDKKERLLKIRFTIPDQEMQSPWSKLG